jgi:hypothetical protein
MAAPHIGWWFVPSEVVSTIFAVAIVYNIITSLVVEIAIVTAVAVVRRVCLSRCGGVAMVLCSYLLQWWGVTLVVMFSAVLRAQTPPRSAAQQINSDGSWLHSKEKWMS